MKVVLITAIYGVYDTLKDLPEQTIKCDQICFTDQDIKSDQWQIVNSMQWEQYVSDNASDNIKAKFYKVLSHQVAEIKDYDYFIWIDASLQVKRKDFIQMCIEEGEKEGAVFWYHPERNCAYVEGEYSRNINRYESQPINEQLAFYQSSGLPEHFGLWCGGIFARKNNLKWNTVFDEWFLQITKYSIQDQLSLPYAFFIKKTIPATLNIPLYKNTWIEKKPHLNEPIDPNSLIYRYDIINWFIKEYGYKSYLEIGIDKAECFNRVQCELKEGVDPNKPCTHQMTSDLFFQTSKKKYDIIFIDGLHLKDQAIKDIANSLKVLNKGGTILCHDCRPTDEVRGGPVPQPGKPWYGTVWQAWTYYRAKKNLHMICLDTDCGLGIIRKGVQKPYEGPFDKWSDFVTNRNEMLNLVPASKLVELYGVKK